MVGKKALVVHLLGMAGMNQTVCKSSHPKDAKAALASERWSRE